MGIAVRDIAYVTFEAPDLDVLEDFYRSFGMAVVDRTPDLLLLGDAGGRVRHVTRRGDAARFVGIAFEAEAGAAAEAGAGDVERLVSSSGFERVDGLPSWAGATGATATDPDGFTVTVVEGGAAGDAPAPIADPVARNDARRRPRTGEPVRLPTGPSSVRRLGHAVLDVSDYPRSSAWYREHLGLLVSDEIRVDEGDTPIGGFLRCDRGPVPVDHHTLFLLGTGTPRFNHAAFEVTDLDDLMVGHTHLAGAGHRAQWGVGRHILGSQIYDYWLDPNGFMVEHWTDGDLFDASVPPGVAGIEALIGSQWGPTAGGPPA